MLCIDINGMIGSGKTTVAKIITKALEAEGYTVIERRYKQSDNVILNRLEGLTTEDLPVLLTDGGHTGQDVINYQLRNPHINEVY